jgi:D-mannonate dehydratase
MKSLILDLEENLTNDQIDAIIKKLEARKKVERTQGFQPTKEQKQILSQLKKIFKYDPEHIEECDIETTIYNLDEVFSQEEADLEYKIENTYGHISRSEEDINIAKGDIIDFEKDITKYKKELKKLEENQVKLNEANKLFSKLKKMVKK